MNKWYKWILEVFFIRIIGILEWTNSLNILNTFSVNKNRVFGWLCQLVDFIRTQVPTTYREKNNKIRMLLLLWIIKRYYKLVFLASILIVSFKQRIAIKKFSFETQKSRNELKKHVKW